VIFRFNQRNLLQCQAEQKWMLLVKITFSGENYFHTSMPVSTPARRLTAAQSAIADYKQRWRQRGKTAECSFKFEV